MAELRRLPAPVITLWDWQMHAACRETDAGVFFHPSRERGPAAAARDAAAKRVCAVCPVIEECGLYALLVQEPYGVWGGLTAGERHELLRAGRGALRRLAGRTRTRPEERIPLTAEFRASTTVNADAAALFAFLSDVRNLPRYVSRMTAARTGDGNEVLTESETPDGTRAEGEAWFDVDRDALRIAWGFEGPSDYRGSLEVTDIGTAGGPGSQVTVWLHTTRVPEHDGIVQGALDATVAAVGALAEEHYAST